MGTTTLGRDRTSLYDVLKSETPSANSPEAQRQAPSAAKKSYEHLRKPPSQSDFRLTREALEFIASLEHPMRPMETAKTFPRIVNRIAELWRSPSAMEDYFEDLLIDKRGDRKGFPLQIVLEIGTLREYYFSAVSRLAPLMAWDKKPK